MFQQDEIYIKMALFSEVSTFWTILNDEPVKDKIKAFSKRNKAEALMAFDFSTLYTKIPYNKLLKQTILFHIKRKAFKKAVKYLLDN